MPAGRRKNFPLALDAGPALLDAMNIEGLPPESGEPLVDAVQAANILCAEDAEQQAELREIFLEMEATVGRQIAAAQAGLETLSVPDARRLLHTLKGNTATFGLRRCSRLLAWAEEGWSGLAGAQRRQIIVAIEKSFTAGVAELRQRFPGLTASRNGLD